MVQRQDADVRPDPYATRPCSHRCAEDEGIGWVLGVEVVLGGPYLVETQILCQLGELQYLLIVLSVGSAELGRVLCEKEQSKLHTRSSVPRSIQACLSLLSEE